MDHAEMPTRNYTVPVLIIASLVLLAHPCVAQNSVAEFHQVLRQKAAFAAVDLAALEHGATVVKLLPVEEKREVAVSGLVRLQAPAQLFLQSFREGLATKNNPAILEIGRFSSKPTLDDLQALTIDKRDLEDLKTCEVGDCQLKLSSAMIERLQEQVNWEASDYQLQATQLLKQMLLDYVNDYRARGDSALIEYSDKRKAIRLAEEQRGLMATSSYLNDVLSGNSQYLKGFSRSNLVVVEDALVWSKIKFGLKPVIAVNHVVIYQQRDESGPQILISSRQIYANHYFDSSLSLTAFVTIPGASASYLLYENRSRADGLEGVFSKLKRGIVESRAINSLKTILQSSQQSLEARALNLPGAPQVESEPSGSRWRITRGLLFLCLLWISALLLFLGRGALGWKRTFSRGTPH